MWGPLSRSGGGLWLSLESPKRFGHPFILWDEISSSAPPLKVGRKPKLTSNKVFEVVRGGSWGNCCSERGGWRREAVNYSCLMPSYWVRCSRLGPVTARGWEADLAWVSLENHLCLGRKGDTGALFTFLMGPETWSSLPSSPRFF